jgi:hypothetical protein
MADDIDIGSLAATGTPTTWEPQLPLEIALGIEDLDAIALRHRLSFDQLNALLCTPGFQIQVAHFRKDLHENGETFRAKARVQAEMMLETSYKLVHADSTPASVKADLIKSTVEWAGLKPNPKATLDTPGGQFNITFNFPLPSGAPAPAMPKAPRPTITVDNPGA